MPTSDPTARTVADAVLRYRQLRELTHAELAVHLARVGHALPTDALVEIEVGSRVVGVGDLLALAFVLQVTPAVLLAHIPMDLSQADQGPASGLPQDLGHDELRAWIQGETALDPVSRRAWNEDRTAQLRIRALHQEDQLRGARAELADLGSLAEYESDTPIVQRLHDRISQHEHELQQTDVALALTEQRLNRLGERKGAAAGAGGPRHDGSWYTWYLPAILVEKARTSVEAEKGAADGSGRRRGDPASTPGRRSGSGGGGTAELRSRDAGQPVQDTTPEHAEHAEEGKQDHEHQDRSRDAGQVGRDHRWPGWSRDGAHRL